MKLPRHLRMTTFALRLKHDNGTKVLKVTAQSLKAAKEMAMKAEGCPESAIS